jgi:hypothetical protein
MPRQVCVTLFNLLSYWNGAGKLVSFTAPAYQMRIMTATQEDSLFTGLLVNDECSAGLGGVFSGNVTHNGQVTMTIHVGCYATAVDFKITHLFNGQLSTDNQRIAGVMQSLEDSATIAITFTRD